MLDILSALLLGAVEGITEFLPISSTGHLILVTDLLGIEHTEFVKTFEIAIQLGAILSVVFLYGKKLLFSRGTLARVIIAFLPTAVLGVILYPFIKGYLLGNSAVVLWALFIGGILLVMFEYWYAKRFKNHDSGLAKGEAVKEADLDTITIRQAFIVGLAQSVSMIPGVSRAGATIVGGLLAGLSRKTIVEFSFLLAIPTMAAATGLDLLSGMTAFSGREWLLLGMGFLSAFVFALLAVRFLLRFIQHHSFVGFGIYRIVAAVIFFLVLF